jgi:hypothetical protein
VRQPTRTHRLLTVLLAVVAANILAGCGGSTSKPNATTSAASTASTGVTSATTSEEQTSPNTAAAQVASVNAQPISYSEFAHQYTVATRRSGDAIPDPPSYTKCIKELGEIAESRLEKPPVGSADSKKAHAVAECRHIQATRTNEAMQTLVRRKWSEVAAKQAGLAVGTTEARKRAQEQLQSQTESVSKPEREQALGGKKQQQPSEQAQEDKYLTANGLTMEDLEAEATAELLFAAIVRKAIAASAPAKTKPAPEPPVTQDEIEAFYHAHTSELAQPPSRNINIVKLKTIADAEKAKTELEHGASFKKVGHLDPELNYYNNYRDLEEGITAPNTPESSGEDLAIEKAAFSAAQGTLVGPVKGEFSYYFVLRVASEKPGKTNPLPAVKSRVVSMIKVERSAAVQKAQEAARMREEAAAGAYEKRFVAEWTSKTSCAKGFVIGLCSNGTAAMRAAELRGH